MTPPLSAMKRLPSGATAKAEGVDRPVMSVALIGVPLAAYSPMVPAWSRM